MFYTELCKNCTVISPVYSPHLVFNGNMYEKYDKGNLYMLVQYVKVTFILMLKRLKSQCGSAKK